MQTAHLVGRFLRPYDDEQSLPKGVTPLTQHLSVPDVLARRMSQIGLVDSDDAQRLQSSLKPGQRHPCFSRR